MRHPLATEFPPPLRLSSLPLPLISQLIKAAGFALDEHSFVKLSWNFHCLSSLPLPLISQLIKAAGFALDEHSFMELCKVGLYSRIKRFLFSTRIAGHL
jgi:hypothetical protein